MGYTPTDKSCPIPDEMGNSETGDSGESNSRSDLPPEGTSLGGEGQDRSADDPVPSFRVYIDKLDTVPILHETTSEHLPNTQRNGDNNNRTSFQIFFFTATHRRLAILPSGSGSIGGRRKNRDRISDTFWFTGHKV